MLLFCNKLLRDSNKNGAFIWWREPTKNVFAVYSQCRSKTFLGESRWNACFCAYPQRRSSTYVGGVYMILILRAWQTSHKDQQSLTKLNTKQVAYKSGSFPSLNIMFGSGRNPSFVIQELNIYHFYVFKDKSPEL